MAADAATARAGAREPDPVVLSGRILTKQSFIYGLGSALVLPLGLISLIVTTRYLRPNAFGHLTALLATSVLVLHLGTIGCLQGTLLSVYGVGGEADGDVGGDATDDGDDEELIAHAAGEGRRLLGSGMVLTLIQNVVLTAIGIALAKPIDDLIVHSGDVAAVRLALACGTTGAVWTFSSQLYRLERRVGAHVALSTVRPVLVIALTLAALVSGGGVHGVLVATLLGNAISALLAFAITVGHYRFRPRLADAAWIYSRGWRLAPLILIAYVRNSADALLLNQASSAHVVGLYGVASRIASIPMYFSTAFLQAWAPMERSPIFRATRARIGRPKFAGALFTYLVILNLSFMVALSLGSDLLIRLAAPSYAKAAPLIPWVAGATVVGAVFYATYRASFFRQRRWAYEVLGGVGAFAYAGVGYLLLHTFGPYAIPAVAIVVGLLGVIGMDIWDRACGHTLMIDYRAILLAVALAVLSVVVAKLGPRYTPVPRVVADLLVLALYPVLLVLTRVVPRERVGRLMEIASALRPRRLDRRALLVRWPELTVHERDALAAAVLGKPQPVADIARRARVTEAVIYARITRGLRRLARLAPDRPIDDRIGAYILAQDPMFERDWEAIKLSGDGARLEELHTLEVTYKTLRRGARVPRPRRPRRPQLPALPAARTQRALPPGRAPATALLAAGRDQDR
jgi:O-antigen/teichoic acid export membrane protein